MECGERSAECGVRSSVESGVRRTESGEQKWSVESGVRRAECGEWRVESGERSEMRKAAVIVFVILGLLLAGCGSGGEKSDAGATASGDAAVEASASSGAQEAVQTEDARQPGSGGAQETAQGTAPGDSAAFVFETGRLTIHMGERAAPVIEALGDPQNYFEAPSCAFDGIDKIYCYSGFELYTYPVGDEDYISSVNLTDDSIPTSEGVYLGMSYSDMTAAYGENYTQNFGQYTYSLGDSALSFLVEDDIITVVTYNYTNMPV